MWIFQPNLFVSVVRDATDPNYVLVRARRRADLQRFVGAAHRDAVQRTLAADYPFRARLAKAQFLEALLHAGEQVTYTNVKGAIAPRDQDRSHVMHRVWAEVLGLEGLDTTRARARNRLFRAPSRLQVGRTSVDWGTGAPEGPGADLEAPEADRDLPPAPRERGVKAVREQMGDLADDEWDWQ